ncbi:thiol-disulfide oxidoreductase DCC family protein [Demequina sp. SO4-13]|uniref:thiol-disulfide oxidoreductase DCC family protein n=1 Tax=Demequina sp. SO4-13 TaxID=3401027 RepID=UPI003AF8C7CF
MSRPIVVFDGDCGLCNGFIAWLIRHDRDRRFLITGSDGPVGRAALGAMGLPPEIAASTLVVATCDGARLRSDAVAEVAAGLGWPWRAAASMRIVPRGLRDGVYRAIASRRPRRPAIDPSCGTPPPGLVGEWRARLATREDVAALVAA